MVAINKSEKGYAACFYDSSQIMARSGVVQTQGSYAVLKINFQT